MRRCPFYALSNGPQRGEQSDRFGSLTTGHEKAGVESRCWPVGHVAQEDGATDNIFPVPTPIWPDR